MTIVSTGQITIADLNDGMAMVLSKYSLVIPTAADGSAPVYTGASFVASVLLGRLDDSANWQFFATPGAGVTGSLSGQTYTLTALSQDISTVAISATRQGYATVSAVCQFAKVKAGVPGAAGANSMTVTIYQRSATTTALAKPTQITTYTFATGVLTGLDNGWSTSMPAADVNKPYTQICTATAYNTTATDAIAASEWSNPIVFLQDGSNGKDSTAVGPRGTVQIWLSTTKTAWNDADAVAAIAAAGYGTPINRDVVTEYNNSAKFSEMRFYNNGTWTQIVQYFPGSILVDGTVYGTALVANTVTADKIDGRNLSIKDANGNVIIGTNVPLLLSYAASGTVNSDLTPSITAAQTTATNAQNAATNATSAIANIISDNYLSKGEKPQVIIDYVAIYNEEAGIYNQANALGVAVADYYTKWSALVNYMQGLSPAYSDITQDTAIDGPTFRAKFTDYYSARNLVLNATAAAAATKANWASINSKPADSAILNSNVKVGLNLAPTASQWVLGGGTYQGNCGAAYNSADTRSQNGEFYNMGGQDNVFNGMTIPLVGLSAGDWYTVSFLAHSSGQIMNSDFIGTNVDTNGINVNITTSNQYVTYTEQMPSNLGSTPTFRLWTGNNGQGVLVSNLKIERGMSATPWSNDVITAGNSAQIIKPNAVNNTMFGGDLFASNWNGYIDGRGQGWYLSRTGNMYMTNMYARGTISGGAFNESYAWPAQGAGGGYHISASGILLGNPNDGGFTQITSTGEMHMPGFDYAGRQLTLQNTILYNPTIGAQTAASISGGGNYSFQSNTQYNDTYLGVYNASMSGGSGNYSYEWSVSPTSSQVRCSLGGPPNNSQVQVFGTFKLINQEVDVYVSCKVTDLNTGTSRTVRALSTISTG